MISNEEKKLNSIAKETSRHIYEVSAVFPFDLFPNTIKVDENKIDIIYKWFFWNKYIFTILLDDLTTVKYSTGPFFATIHFEVRGYESNPEPVRKVWKWDAVKLHEIVVGLTKAKREKVDLGKVDREVVKSHLPRVGRIKENISSAV